MIRSLTLVRWLAVGMLWLAAGVAGAQALPVSVTVSGNVAAVQIGTPSMPVADLTLTFDNAIGLSAGGLGISAQTVSITDPALLSRLPSPRQTRLDGAFPVLITIEPPAAGGLRFDRTVQVEVHTHALSYVAGSPLRLFKAPLGGRFRDITSEIAPGSVRARGTTGGFSQFLVLADLRDSDGVVAEKVASLRGIVATLPAAERPPLDSLLDGIERSIAGGRYRDAIVLVDAFRSRVAARAGTSIPQQWRATRDVDNQAGELLAGAATLKFSIAYLRDYGA